MRSPQSQSDVEIETTIQSKLTQFLKVGGNIFYHKKNIYLILNKNDCCKIQKRNIVTKKTSFPPNLVAKNPPGSCVTMYP